MYVWTFFTFDSHKMVCFNQVKAERLLMSIGHVEIIRLWRIVDQMTSSGSIWHDSFLISWNILEWFVFCLILSEKPEYYLVDVLLPVSLKFSSVHKAASWLIFVDIVSTQYFVGVIESWIVITLVFTLIVLLIVWIIRKYQEQNGKVNG